MVARPIRSALLFIAALAATSHASTVSSQPGGCRGPARHRLLYLGPDSVPAGAGVLVGFGPWSAPELGSVRAGTRAPRITVSFSRGSRRVRANVVELAPGLVRAEPVRALEPASWSIVGVRATRAITVSSDTPAPALDAPVLRALRRRAPSAPPGAEQHASGVLVAELGAAAPSGAVAFIVHAGEAPIQWSPIGSSRSELFVPDAPGHCDAWVPGMRSAAPGEAISIAFVDALGRVSPRSSSVATPR